MEKNWELERAKAVYKVECERLGKTSEYEEDTIDYWQRVIELGRNTDWEQREKIWLDKWAK